MKAGDISSVGAFKTSTIKALNEVINHERLVLFPSASSVDRPRAKLDQYAFEVIGYERRKTVYGFFFFEFWKGTSLFAEGLSIGWSCTCVVHPVTKQPLYCIDDETKEEKIVKIQSSEMCCILFIADAWDKKELYEEVFKTFYEWGNKINTTGLPVSNGEPALLPFVVTHTTDKKSLVAS
jgi:hypothetical protein